MVFVAVLIFFAVLGQIVSAQGITEAKMAVEILGAVTFFGGILTMFSARTWQIEDFEAIKKTREIEDIYKEKAAALTAEFTKHLAEAYPDHEKGIFNKIGPDQVAIYFTKYPALKASETLLELVKRINELQSSVYNQRIEAEKLLAQTRIRLRSPWFFKFMIPKE